ncbi:hypothetical protein Mvan_5548 [Mycolicibacterium vanbaalenii PYR-1]|uniref:Uncharacterized protein n=1 Tax=Mycolicibacterium vanbaalenii (strain DSM 7251 / JCM 13017 / BCRC 16820 / KCTC 9966 / NRRL B-24157 / PYR-1) TaxID=350058 RepID=A1TGL4_MYCVP|nr:hypothetical protein Mvan_5548 [Mycolicibacterium vanbaalenii PYR-1]
MAENPLLSPCAGGRRHPDELGHQRIRFTRPARHNDLAGRYPLDGHGDQTCAHRAPPVRRGRIDRTSSARRADEGLSGCEILRRHRLAARQRMLSWHHQHPRLLVEHGDPGVVHRNEQRVPSHQHVNRTFSEGPLLVAHPMGRLGEPEEIAKAIG